MWYRELITVLSEINTKHVTTCRTLKLAAVTVPARLYKVKGPCSNLNESSHIYFQKSTKFARGFLKYKITELYNIPIGILALITAILKV
jgi:hypothetical protein